MRYDEVKWPLIAEIEECRYLIKKNNEEIREKEVINKALESEIVRRIRKIVTVFSDKMLHNASLQQNKEKAEDKQMYKFVKEEMKERFFPNIKNVKLNSIITCGYDAYGYSFRFTVKGIELDIFYPNVSNVNEDNFVSAHYGKYHVSYNKSGCLWSTICDSYKEEECAAKIEEFLGEVSK